MTPAPPRRQGESEASHNARLREWYGEQSWPRTTMERSPRPVAGPWERTPWYDVRVDPITLERVRVYPVTGGWRVGGTGEIVASRIVARARAWEARPLL